MDETGPSAPRNDDPDSPLNEFRKGTIMCPSCREQYRLNRVLTMTDNDVMEYLTGGGARVLGRRPNRPVLVGHSTRRDTPDRDLQRLFALGSDFDAKWTCEKCHAENLWRFSYMPFYAFRDAENGTSALSGQRRSGRIYFVYLWVRNLLLGGRASTERQSQPKKQSGTTGAASASARNQSRTRPNGAAATKQDRAVINQCFALRAI